jgi:CRP/FNR family cyclic AMP-dependent transcriptional regulator
MKKSSTILLMNFWRDMRNLNLIDKAFLLKKTALFGSLDLDILLSIADKMESLHYHPQDPIFQIHQDAHRMYLILSGHISICDSQGSEIAQLKAGDFFGDEAIFSEKKRAYSATSASRVELLALTRSHLLSIIQECPSVALSLLEAYANQQPFRRRNEKSP